MIHSLVAGVVLPAQQLWVGKDLVQLTVLADGEGQHWWTGVAGEVSGDPCWERQHHLTSDLHQTPTTHSKT